MTTGELHGVSYVTETMFQNVTAYALYEPRCAHGKDDGCHGEQRHQVGHYYGAAGQGSVAAHLVCDDVDIDGGRHGADDDQGDQLLRRKAGGDPMAAQMAGISNSLTPQRRMSSGRSFFRALRRMLPPTTSSAMVLVAAWK